MAEKFIENGRQDGVMYLYIDNVSITTDRDPWFNIGPNDNLALLAPGSTDDFADDIAIDFWSSNANVKPSRFGLPPD
jgi:hypothetical protein